MAFWRAAHSFSAVREASLMGNGACPETLLRSSANVGLSRRMMLGFLLPTVRLPQDWSRG